MTASFLRQIFDRLDQYFSGWPVTLEAVWDYDGGCPLLIVRVHNQGDVDDALRRIDRFDDEWWLEAGDAENWPVLITVV